MQPARPPASQAAQGGGNVAKKRREQKQRADARHVSWLTGLLQQASSHHSGGKTADAAMALRALVGRVQLLEEKVQALGHTTDEEVGEPKCEKKEESCDGPSERIEGAGVVESSTDHEQQEDAVDPVRAAAPPMPTDEVVGVSDTPRELQMQRATLASSSSARVGNGLGQAMSPAEAALSSSSAPASDVHPPVRPPPGPGKACRSRRQRNQAWRVAMRADGVVQVQREGNHAGVPLVSPRSLHRGVVIPESSWLEQWAARQGDGG